jgi:hypothetical protein
MPRKDVIANIEARIDQLIEDLEVDLMSMVTLNRDLARDPTVRCATRQRAAAKHIDWYAGALAMKAKLALPEDDEVTDQQIKVLMVDKSDVELARARAAAFLAEENTKRLGR